MHTQSGTEIIADTCHFNSLLIGAQTSSPMALKVSGYESDLAYYVCEQLEQATRSRTETETTTALAVMHTQLETQVATCTEIITNTCHYNSPLTGAQISSPTALKGRAWMWIRI